MAYETGAAATVDALLQKISTFALGLGWTINRDVTWATGRELCVYHANAGYFNLRSTNTIQDFQSNIQDPAPWIDIWGSTAYDAGNVVSAMTGTTPLGCRTNGLPPDFHKYHLFGTTEYIHCIIEIQPGLFAHLGFGMAEKSWNYTGGEYVFGTYWNHYNSRINHYDDTLHSYPLCAGGNGVSSRQYFRIDLEGVSPRWFVSYITSSDAFMSTFSQGADTSGASSLYGSTIFKMGANSVSGISPLMPCILANKMPPDVSYIAGRVKDVRFTNIEIIAPNSTITYGTDDWIVFPIKKKQLVEVTEPEFSSSIYAIAYRKV